MSYPQGWHLNAAFDKWLLRATDHYKDSPGRTVAFFYLYTIMWFAIFCFIVVRLGLYLVRERRKSTHFISKLVVLFFLAIGLALWFLPLFLSGFQTAIAAWLFLLIEIIFIIEACEASKLQAKYNYIALALFMFAGINYMWVFLAPVALLPIAVILLNTIRLTKSWPPFNFIFWGILALASASFQVIVQMKVAPHTNVPFIDLTGFIDHTSMAILLAVMTGIAIYFYYNRSLVRFKVVFLYTVAAIIFSIILMLHQLSTLHELRYYYFKSTYAFIVLALIASSFIIGNTVNKMFLRTPKQSKKSGVLHISFILIATLILGACLLTLLKPKILTATFQGGARGISQQQADALSTELVKDQVNGYRMIFIGSCNRGDDIRASDFANSLSYIPPRLIPHVGSSITLSRLNEDTLFNQINHYLDRETGNITIVSSDQVISQRLKKALGNNISRVTLIDVDSTLETEPQSQCPDRVRLLTPDDIKAGIL